VNNLPAEPFSVDIMIGEESARSVAGPNALLIKGGILNIAQLIVTDDDGKIVAFEEVRKERVDETSGVLRIASIPFGQTYHFLLLMGHLDYTKVNETYEYLDDVAPTLLAAGLKEQRVTGSGKVTVTMLPLVVDTVFTTSEGRTAAPVINSGKSV
jgi:hypothetical protein